MDWTKYESNKKPKLPRKVFGSWIKRTLGIVSPTRFHSWAFNENKDYSQYMFELRKWLLCKRKLNKVEFDCFYRSIRIKSIEED